MQKPRWLQWDEFHSFNTHTTDAQRKTHTYNNARSNKRKKTNSTTHLHGKGPASTYTKSHSHTIKIRHITYAVEERHSHDSIFGIPNPIRIKFLGDNHIEQMIIQFSGNSDDYNDYNRRLKGWKENSTRISQRTKCGGKKLPHAKAKSILVSKSNNNSTLRQTTASFEYRHE